MIQCHAPLSEKTRANTSRRAASAFRRARTPASTRPRPARCSRRRATATPRAPSPRPDTCGASPASRTGYLWGEPRLKPHVRRLLEEAEALPDAERNPRYVRVARRYLGE